MPNQPSAVSLSPHSLRTNSPTAPRILRSKKFIMLMANRMESAKTGPGAWFHLRGPPAVKQKEKSEAFRRRDRVPEATPCERARRYEQRIL